MPFVRDGVCSVNLLTLPAVLSRTVVLKSSKVKHARLNEIQHSLAMDTNGIGGA